MVTFTKNFEFNFRRDHQKISYERRAYESVDEKKPILGYVPKNDKKKSGGKRLKERKLFSVIILSLYAGKSYFQ